MASNKLLFVPNLIGYGRLLLLACAVALQAYGLPWLCLAAYALQALADGEARKFRLMSDDQQQKLL